MQPTVTMVTKGHQRSLPVDNWLGHADPSMMLRVYDHAVESADEALAQILGNTSRRVAQK